MDQFEFLESYLRSIFGFVGIVDINFFNAQPMDVSADLRRSALHATTSEARRSDLEPSV